MLYMTAVIGSCPPATLNWISDEWVVFLLSFNTPLTYSGSLSTEAVKSKIVGMSSMQIINVLINFRLIKG